MLLSPRSPPRAHVEASAAGTSISTIPDYARYDSFFFRVTWFEDLANQRASKGKDGGALRSVIRREAELTLAEEAALKSIAADYRQKLSATNDAIRKGALAGGKVDLQALSAQKVRLVVDHIDQLRSALNPASFRRLDAYVKSVVKVQMPRGQSQK